METEEIIDSGKVRIEKMREILDNKIQLGALVKSFTEHQGFEVLKAIFYNFRQDVKDRDNYPDIHAFRTDRRALKIIDGLFNELDAMMTDAEQAAEELRKVIESESSTPTLLTLDGEGDGDGQDVL